MRQIRSGENMRAARLVRTSIEINNSQPEKNMITILRRDIVAVLAWGSPGCCCHQLLPLALKLPQWRKTRNRP